MITPYNILRHELVGLSARAQAGGKAVEGVVDAETAKTIKLKTPKGVKTVPKGQCALDLSLPDGAVVRVEGALLAGRPENRIKKKHRIRF